MDQVSERSGSILLAGGWAYSNNGTSDPLVFV
ncbi:hypothetical protein IGJ18_001494 [Enterococcus sp. AZ078]